MKVALFRRKYLAHGGGERFTQEFLRGLSLSGHQVHLFSQAWTDPPKGVRVHRVPTFVGGSAAQTLGYALLAPRLARGVGVDLVHSFERTLHQDIYRAGEGCHRQWLAVRRRYLPGIDTTLDGLRPFHRVVLAIERRICQRDGAKIVITNSHMVRQDFERHYSPLRPFTILIRNGLDLDRFHPSVRASRRECARREMGLKPEQLVLLSVGSGFHRKGIPTLLRALGQLKRRERLTPIALIVGKGKKDPLLDLARREGVEGQIRILGVVEDLLPLYSAADLFVLPSVYDPASNATLEAMGMGLPVITTRNNGSGEILEHQRSGWLLEDPVDSRALADLIAEVADPPVRRLVGEAGRRAVEPWTWERHLTETLALYTRLPGPRNII